MVLHILMCHCTIGEIDIDNRRKLWGDGRMKGMCLELLLQVNLGKDRKDKKGF